MDLPPGWQLSVEDRPSPAARNRLGRELGKHNRPYLRNAKWGSDCVAERPAAQDRLQAVVAG